LTELRGREGDFVLLAFVFLLMEGTFSVFCLLGFWFIYSCRFRNLKVRHCERSVQRIGGAHRVPERWVVILR